MFRYSDLERGILTGVDPAEKASATAASSAGYDLRGEPP
jgi:hypothetical protein